MRGIRLRRPSFGRGEGAVHSSTPYLAGNPGSAQFFPRSYQLCLEASFRADFTFEQLTAALGRLIDQLWPNCAKAVAEAGVPAEYCTTELVLGGWSPKTGRMMATAYAKHDAAVPAVPTSVAAVLFYLAAEVQRLHYERQVLHDLFAVRALLVRSKLCV